MYAVEHESGTRDGQIIHPGMSNMARAGIPQHVCPVLHRAMSCCSGYLTGILRICVIRAADSNIANPLVGIVGIVLCKLDPPYDMSAADMPICWQHIMRCVGGISNVVTSPR